MAQNDTLDFAAAFAIGALVGAGAVLLLRPAPPSRAIRISRSLAPYREQMGRSARRARSGLAESADAAADFGGALGGMSRELADDLRKELGEMVAEARSELATSIEEQVERARGALRRGSSRR